MLFRSPGASRRDPLSAVESAPVPARPPEDGFIRLTEKTREKADVRFCFGSKTENSIGAHIIEQYKKQLRPRIKDDMIELCCCLDSHPGRTFVIKLPGPAPFSSHLPGRPCPQANAAPL